MAFLQGLIGRLKGGPEAPAAPAAGSSVLASEARGRYERGVAALGQGNAQDAADLLRQAIALRTRDDDFLADAQLQLARAASRLGEGAEVVASIEALLTASPQDAGLLTEAVRLLHDCGLSAEALDCAQRLVAVQPSPAAQVLLAQQLHAGGRDGEALRALAQALAAEPRNADALRGRSQILLRLGRIEEALAACDQVLALAGESPTNLANRAAVLERLGKDEAALRDLERALELAPGDRRALVNRVAALTALLRLPEAKMAAQEALRLHPAAPELHLNLSMVHLLLGELPAGWAEREWRWRIPSRATQAVWSGPRWAGEDLRGRTLLLFAEQGFGDAIQFLRYLPQLAQQAGRIVLAAPRELEGLLRDLPPNCRLLRAGDDLPAYDFQCPFLSVPGIVGTTLDTIPAPAGYLRADPKAVQAWKKRLDDGSGRRTVGLVWSGNASHVNDHNRSIPLLLLRPLADTDCRFVSLQPEVRDRDAAVYAAWPGLLRFGEEVSDFAGTAALVEALDVVVTVDTSVAHLAGALGRPVWILLPHAPDWRWLLEREDSPWYPSARLLRQPATGQWAPVVERVRQGLGSATLPVAERHAVSAKDWIARGNAALQKWDLAVAAECYRQAMAAEPADPIARLNLGFALLETSAFEEAEERLSQALAMRRPADDFAHEAHYLLARAYAALGRPAEALLSCEAALRIRPDFTEASLLLADALAAAGRKAEAAEVLGAVCANQPGNRDASFQYFTVLFGLARFAEALAEAQRLLALTGPDPAVLGNVAAAQGRLGQPAQALAALDEALRLDPGHRDLLVNRAAVLSLLGRAREAADCAREGLRLFPDDANLHWNLAGNLLLLGEFEQGWAEHEWRNHDGTLGWPAGLTQPRWRGEDLSDRTILLYGEQGFGDIIQFLRFVPEIARRARVVHLRVLRSLEPLLTQLPANCVLVPQGAALPATDFECPLMSLPAVLGTIEASIPAQVPYLRADPGRVRAWRERLPTDRLNVGIAWSGKPTHFDDRNRSMPLATVMQAAAGGCRFVTVQPQLSEGDRSILATWPEVLDAGRELRDFADTAALMEVLDVVVSVDTSAAHLAGALGRPVWILLPYVPDWRWMLERADSPWYPTARLYRQPAAGDWAPVLARVRHELAALAGKAR